MTAPASTPPPGIELGDRSAALGWLRGSELPGPTQRALARFVRRFGEATFYRELPEHHDRVEALLGRRLPRWYRRIRSALAFVFPGELEDVWLAGEPDGRYRFDLCGADLSFLADRPRHPAIPLADAQTYGTRGTLGLRASGAGVWLAWSRFNRRYRRKPRSLELAYPSYLALLDDVVRVKLADGRILWAPSRRAETWHQRGVRAVECGENEDAIQCFSRAVSLDPLHRRAWYQLGITYEEAEREAEAREAFGRCAACDAEDRCDYWSEVGVALIRLDRPAEALAALDNAVAAGPPTADLSFHRGVALQGLGRLDEALDAFLRVIELDPDHGAAWVNASFIEHRRGGYAAAVDLCNRGLEHRRSVPELYFNRACAHAMLGERDWALSSLSYAIRSDPKYASDARADDAFAGLRGDPGFLALTAP